MSNKLHNYVRTYRKRASLTQGELAFLLGSESGAKISRIERRSRLPNLRTAFACEAVFGVPAHQIFAGFFDEVESATTTRAKVLTERLHLKAASRARDRKLQALQGITARRGLE